METKSFKIVYIPSDTSQPLAEWTIEIPEGEEVGCLIDRLRAHYDAYDAQRPATAAEKAHRKQVMRKQIAAGSKGQLDNIADDLLDQIMQGARVDSVPLLTNKRDHDFIAVNLYVDDQGIGKMLPWNARASDICMRLGQPLQVLGDAFVAQYFDDEDEFRRMDFTLNDLDMNSKWAKLAQAANAQRQGQPGPTGSPIFVQLDDKSEPTTLPAPNECSGGLAGCQNPASMQCARCKGIKYCSPKCQKADWPRHKRGCKAPPAAAKS